MTSEVLSFFGTLDALLDDDPPPPPSTTPEPDPAAPANSNRDLRAAARAVFDDAVRRARAADVACRQARRVAGSYSHPSVTRYSDEHTCALRDAYRAAIVLRTDADEDKENQR